MKARKQSALPLLERIDLERAQAMEARICTLLRTLLREGPGAKRTAVGIGVAHETLLRKINQFYPEQRLTLAQFACCLLALGPQAPQVLELLAALLDAPQPHAVQGYNAGAILLQPRVPPSPPYSRGKQATGLLPAGVRERQ